MIETLDDLDKTSVLDVGIAHEDIYWMTWMEDNSGRTPSTVGPWHKVEKRSA